MGVRTQPRSRATRRADPSPVLPVAHYSCSAPFGAQAYSEDVKSIINKETLAQASGRLLGTSPAVRQLNPTPPARMPSRERSPEKPNRLLQQQGTRRWSTAMWSKANTMVTAGVRLSKTLDTPPAAESVLPSPANHGRVLRPRKEASGSGTPSPTPVSV